MTTKQIGGVLLHNSPMDIQISFLHVFDICSFTLCWFIYEFVWYMNYIYIYNSPGCSNHCTCSSFGTINFSFIFSLLGHGVGAYPSCWAKVGTSWTSSTHQKANIERHIQTWWWEQLPSHLLQGLLYMLYTLTPPALCKLIYDRCTHLKMSRVLKDFWPYLAWQNPVELLQHQWRTYHLQEITSGKDHTTPQCPAFSWPIQN